jgi:hypothetical protein
MVVVFEVDAITSSRSPSVYHMPGQPSPSAESSLCPCVCDGGLVIRELV